MSMQVESVAQVPVDDGVQVVVTRDMPVVDRSLVEQLVGDEVGRQVFSQSQVRSIVTGRVRAKLPDTLSDRTERPEPNGDHQ